MDNPVKSAGSLVALSGTLAPDGAVIKAGAATPALFTHTGPAAVFDSLTDLAARLDDPALGLTPDHVLILRNIGPAAAGMPEAGAIPIPRYLARQGVRDMVRISDGRMSGTAYGTVILHVTPEAARGGPLALVRDGDPVRLDVPGKRLDLLVEPSALESRRQELAGRTPSRLPDERGWRRLYAEHVTSATEGADLDFMIPPSSAQQGLGRVGY